MNAIPLVKDDMDAITPRLVFDKRYRIFPNQTADPNIVNDLSIYTDGIDTKQGVFWGVYFRSLILKLKWTRAAKQVYLIHDHSCKRTIQQGHYYITIQTADKHYLLAFDRPRISSRLILECHKCLSEVAQRNVATVSWIKRQANSTGNRFTDFLTLLLPCQTFSVHFCI